MRTRTRYAHRATCWLDCPRKGCDGQVEVEVRVDPGCESTWEYPGDPAHAEIIDYTDDYGHEHRLTDRELDDLSCNWQARMLEAADRYMGG